MNGERLYITKALLSLKMSDSGTIYSESEISEDENLHTSDEDFLDDSESETSDEDYLPEYKKGKKVDKVETTVKIKKNYSHL